MNKVVRRGILWLGLPILAIALAIGFRVATTGGLTGQAGSAGAVGEVREVGANAAGNSVQLVVDFGSESGRDVISKRVENFSGTGWQLIEAAGLKAEGTGDYATGFVCRLEGWPSETQQDCVDTPTPAEGTWGYFVTNPEIGPGWIVSGIGSNMHKPKCGQAEAWVWLPPGKEISDARPSVEPEILKCDGN